MPHHSIAALLTPPDSSYHTPAASEESKPAISLSTSLRAGTFDAGANLLRTCSLPDLTSAAAHREEGEGPEGAVSELWDLSSHPVGDPKTEGSEGDDADSSNGEDVFQDDREVSASGGEPPGEGAGSESDDEDEEEEEEEEEEWSSSEDEDLQQLVKTLQSFVEETSKSQ